LAWGILLVGVGNGQKSEKNLPGVSEKKVGRILEFPGGGEKKEGFLLTFVDFPG
jgi:hypothetical protein